MSPASWRWRSGWASSARPDDPTALAFSAVPILAVCWITNRAMAMALRLPLNTESIYITAIILALILPPVTAADSAGVGGLIVASLVAIASKFVFAVRRKHIFNPVAIGVAASALLLDQPATWWIGGNLTFLPFMLIGGLLVVRKVQRFDMVGIYIARQPAGDVWPRRPSHDGRGDQRDAALFAAALRRFRHADRAAHGAPRPLAAALSTAPLSARCRHPTSTSAITT